MTKTDICPLCGHNNVKIEDHQDGFDWYKVSCNNCFTFIIHESIFTQIADLDKEKEKNKRKRLNCIYNFLLKNPRYNKYYYYKFFYEEETKLLSTNDPVKINIASIIDTMPTKTKDKMRIVLNNLIEKYSIGNDIQTEKLDLGLMLIEEENEMQSIVKYFFDEGLIAPTMISAGEITKFRLTMNAKIYLEEGDNMENSKNTNITNITNTTDNSIHISEVKNIKKSNIGQNKTKSEKEIKVETNIETNVAKENRKGLFHWFKRKK
ncbi:MAG: hypothetical protein ACI4TI_01260 [Christensenellales bacterium]